MNDYPAWAWITFGVLLAIMLVIDLVAHRGDHATSRRSAVAWSVIWIVIGLGFGGFVWVAFSPVAAQEYFAAYVIEKSLSVDNLFVFLLIFQSLAIPTNDQRRVLLWGILGALVFRALFIFLGITAIERIDWMVYVFGAILLYAAYKILREDPRDKEGSGTVRWLAKHLPVTHQLHGHRFLVKVNGRTVITPLLIALVALELTDVMFAIDSIPAALSVTRDPFVVYTSNAFAILGLRALYIVLADLVARLRYLHYGLAFVLAFAAVKLLGSKWFHVPAWLSISIIVAAIGVAVIASLMRKPRPDDDVPPVDPIPHPDAEERARMEAARDPAEVG